MMSPNNPPFELPPEVTRLYNDGLKQWQRLVDQQARSWGLDTTAITAQAVEQAQQSSALFAEGISMMQEAFADLPSRLAAGEIPTDLYQRYAERIQQQQQQQAKQVQQVLQDNAAAWQQYVGEILKADQTPWTSFFSGLDGLATNPTASFDAMQNVFDQALGKWLQTPTLGLTRELQEEVNQSLASYRDYKQAEWAYSSFIAETWTKAIQAMSQAVAEEQRTGQPKGLRDLSRLWAKIVDDTFIEAFQDPEYIQRQQVYLEAGLRVKKHRRALLEINLRALDMPTLSDLDDASGYIHALRRENRALKKQVRAARKQLEDLEKQALSAREYARKSAATLRKQVKDERTAREASEAQLAELAKQVYALVADVKALQTKQEASPSAAPKAVPKAKRTTRSRAKKATPKPDADTPSTPSSEA